MIYHITTNAEWQNAQTKGEYTAPSLQTEGFIHCSTAPNKSHLSQTRFTKDKTAWSC
jgi:uncharacterized protein (DUF952 family)